MPPNTDVDNAAAKYERGVALHDRGEISLAEKWWRAAADAGHTGAGRNIDALAKPCPQETANE